MEAERSKSLGSSQSRISSALPETRCRQSRPCNFLISKERFLQPAGALDMVSLFQLLFSCCLRPHSKNKHPQLPDETSRLIPVLMDPSPHSTSQTHPHIDDPQKIQERLGGIVRSTQGKMVNVTAHLPFNLHNQKLAPRSLDPSSSRSQSSNGYGYPYDGRRASRGPGGVYVRRQPSAGASESPGPSSDYSEDGVARKPLLEVRLVTDAEAAAERTGDSSGASSRRGRKRAREGLEPIGGAEGSVSTPLANGDKAVRSIYLPPSDLMSHFPIHRNLPLQPRVPAQVPVHQNPHPRYPHLLHSSSRTQAHSS